MVEYFEQKDKMKAEASNALVAGRVDEYRQMVKDDKFSGRVKQKLKRSYENIKKYKSPKTPAGLTRFSKKIQSEFIQSQRQRKPLPPQFRRASPISEQELTEREKMHLFEEKLFADALRRTRLTQGEPDRLAIIQKRKRALQDALKRQTSVLKTPFIFKDRKDEGIRIFEKSHIDLNDNVFKNGQNVMRPNRPNILQTKENNNNLNFGSDRDPRNKKRRFSIW